MLNIIAFIVLFGIFRTGNISYSNWLIVTIVTPIVLLGMAIIIYLLPVLRKNKTKEENLMMGKDFITIAKELYCPTIRSYKINGIMRTISYLLGIPFFIANLVLIGVDIFYYVVA